MADAISDRVDAAGAPSWTDEERAAIASALALMAEAEAFYFG